MLLIGHIYAGRRDSSPSYRFRFGCRVFFFFPCGNRSYGGERAAAARFPGFGGTGILSMCRAHLIDFE